MTTRQHSAARASAVDLGARATFRGSGPGVGNTLVGEVLMANDLLPVGVESPYAATMSADQVQGRDDHCRFPQDESG